jgi:hypothetical protein
MQAADPETPVMARPPRPRLPRRLAEVRWRRSSSLVRVPHGVPGLLLGRGPDSLASDESAYLSERAALVSRYTHFMQSAQGYSSMAFPHFLQVRPCSPR